jgi:DNA-binding NarL/FixJ family response regulator
MLRVLLADDHAVLRQGLRSFLESKGVSVVGEACDGREAVRLAASLPLDAAVLDVGMPNLNGLEAARAIVRETPNLRIVLLTMHREDAYVLEALRAGVKGYVLKTQAAADLLDALHTVTRGETYLSPAISGAVVEAIVSGAQRAADPLTPREREILQLIAEGRTTKEAASDLGISVKTAETHRTRIMQKLGVHETAGLVRYAIRAGIIRA